MSTRLTSSPLQTSVASLCCAPPAKGRQNIRTAMAWGGRNGRRSTAPVIKHEARHDTGGNSTRLRRPLSARERQGENAPFAHHTRHRERATHRRSEISADRQPKPDALVRPVQRPADLDEWVEDLLETVGGDSDARVLHVHTHFVADDLAPHVDPTSFRRVLHG